MLRKLMVGILLMSFCFIVAPLWAGEKHDAGGTGKTVTATRSKKCWKRTWVTSEALMGRSTLPVCVAFEEVLNATCEPPEKLVCNWTIPKNETRFSKPQWKPLDPKEYWDLIQDIAVAGWAREYRTGKWESLEREYQKELNEGLLSLKVATVDIDNDGREEKIAFLRRGICGKTGWKDTLNVTLPEGKRIDWRYWHVTMYVNARDGGQILLYNGKVYMFGWEDAWDILMTYEGKLNICQFEYLKGGKKK